LNPMMEMVMVAALLWSGVVPSASF